MNKITVDLGCSPMDFSKPNVSQYTYHADRNIHELTWLKADKEAVDNYFEMMEQIIRKTPYEEIMWVVLNSKVGIAPLNYMIQKTRILNSKLPRRPLNRTAVIVPYMDLGLKIVNNFLAVIARYDQIRFFLNEEGAWNWLLETQAQRMVY